MCCLLNLPPEVLIEVFLRLPIKDCLKLAKTCKAMAEIANIDIFWEKKMRLDFHIKVDQNKSRDSCTASKAKHFYRNILHKYGKLLGVWQLSTFGHYGGLYQVNLLLN